jgi:hypothetical protein
VVQMIEVDSDGFLASCEQRLQLLHGDGVVLSIVEREMADLKKSSVNEQVIEGGYTLSVTSARSSRCKIVLAIFLPVCFFLRRWKPISAALSVRRPLDSSREIQCAVNAKYAARFAFDQISVVKLIRPQERCQPMLVSRVGRQRSNSQKG